MTLIDNLNRVLRYSMETVDNLLGQLHARPESRYPQPDGAHPASDEHTLFRHVVADALDDAGRDSEAGLLRDNKRHVVVRDGRVRLGRFTDRPVRDAERSLLSHVQQWSGDYNAGWYPEIGWTDESGQPRYHNPDLWNGDNEPEGNHPYGTLEVTHYALGDDNVVHHLHYSDLGSHLADQVSRHVDGGDYGWNQKGTPEDAEYRSRLHALRNATYEQVDTTQHHNLTPN